MNRKQDLKSERRRSRDIHELADDGLRSLTRALDDAPRTVEKIGGGVARFISRLFGDT